MTERTTKEITVDGHRFVVTQSGGNASRSFVLIHGIGMGHGYWSGITEKLVTHGTVHAIDLPGFGKSPTPNYALSMEASGDLLAEYVTSRNLKNVTAIGHSMGTQIVAEALARHPQIFDSGVLIAPTVNAFERTIPHQLLRMLQDVASIHPRVAYLGFRYYFQTGLFWYVTKLQQMMKHRVEEVYPRILAPTLVIRGERDPVSPRKWVQSVAGLIPHSHFAEIPGKGHETLITGYEEVSTLILGHVTT